VIDAVGRPQVLLDRPPCVLNEGLDLGGGHVSLPPPRRHPVAIPNAETDLGAPRVVDGSLPTIRRGPGFRRATGSFARFGPLEAD